MSENDNLALSDSCSRASAQIHPLICRDASKSWREFRLIRSDEPGARMDQICQGKKTADIYGFIELKLKLFNCRKAVAEEAARKQLSSLLQ